jgi:hypothetical protein
VSEPPSRPVDVDTGFWLWTAAVPLLAIGYLVDVVAPPSRQPVLVAAMSIVFLVAVVGVVVTFLILMRHGYRWACTVLTGGGFASVVYSVSRLFSVDRPATAAVIYAVSVIVGSVLVGGGGYLLHRKDAHAFFTR